ncbi:glycosyltransferase family 4 protein [Falsibacillus albus]|uniref:Glycosyltransferase family 1 protein n=1 Tax=Falsibacillus albus TaxID=2478915 RepID=A0A3L7JT04_9BACI|nr:glycosyltransferase family 1 protein [Falsibacillus albus]RLQ93978.1 glycosyltransferase family 1 protein [Falsibacillus albus]
MRIALFSDTFFPQVNGVARTLKRYLDYMESKQIECQIFLPTFDSCPSYPNIHQFTSYPFFFYPECRTAVVHPKKIEERLLAFAPDLIHVATPLTMGLYGARIAKKRGIPCVASYHTHFDQYLEYYKLTWLSPLMWKYMKWFHAPFEKIFVPSQETQTHLNEKGFNNVSIWSRGVDSELFHPRKRSIAVKENLNVKDKMLLLYVGRISPEKDVETLKKIILTFPEKLRHKVHWLIVGDGPSKAQLETDLLNEPVTFTGYLEGEELAKVYASADLFVFPSASETFGNVVLEAMSSGLLVITSNRGGVTNIVSDGQNGFMCKEKDEHDFIRKIEMFLLREEKVEYLRYSARKYAELQSWSEIFEKLVTEFKEVVDINQKLKRDA